MAATNNLEKINTEGQIVCSLASLASGSTRESAVVDNTGNLYFDYLVQLTFTIASGTPISTGAYVNIYASAPGQALLWPIIQLSSGAPFTTGAGDGSVGALGIPTALRLIGVMPVSTVTSNAERSLRTEPMSVAAAFGGCAPPKFSILVENQVGVAFSTSTSATGANYLSQTGIYSQSGA